MHLNPEQMSACMFGSPRDSQEWAISELLRVEYVLRVMTRAEIACKQSNRCEGTSRPRHHHLQVGLKPLASTVLHALCACNAVCALRLIAAEIWQVSIAPCAMACAARRAFGMWVARPRKLCIFKGFAGKLLFYTRSPWSIHICVHCTVVMRGNYSPIQIRQTSEKCVHHRPHLECVRCLDVARTSDSSYDGVEVEKGVVREKRGPPGLTNEQNHYRFFCPNRTSIPFTLEEEEC